jgi:CubicO group peptidase (beta-lactamase class C family)
MQAGEGNDGTALEGLGAVLAGAAATAPAPAVAISVFTRTGAVAEIGRGVVDLDSATPLDLAADQWDLASLTKVLVTLPEVLALAEAGALDLDDTLGAVWTPARDVPLARATVRQLLAYAAGLPASAELFRHASGAAEMTAAALALPGEPAKSRPPAAYSDMSYLLLGQMVADRTGRTLAELAATRTGLAYHPKGRCVATERCAWRGRLIAGEVHDENAAAMGGVAGHAGAFGTLAQVREAARHWLARDVVSPAMHAASVTCSATNPRGDRFGLGWWLQPTGGIGGGRGTATGFGMSGFVGNRIWLEPDHDYGVVVLSNRIHPVRVDRAPFVAWASGLLDAVAGVMRRRSESCVK